MPANSGFTLSSAANPTLPTGSTNLACTYAYTGPSTIDGSYTIGNGTATDAGTNTAQTSGVTGFAPGFTLSADWTFATTTAPSAGTNCASGFESGGCFALDAASDSGASTSDRLTNASSLTYNLRFSEAVTDLAAADLAVTGTATGCVVGTPATATVTGYPSGAAYTVTLTSCSAGTVILTLAAQSVLDANSANKAPTSSVAAEIGRAHV